MANVARKIVRHLVFRITWARALARRVHSPAAARQRMCRARRFPRRPGALLDPRPEATRAGRPPRRRAAARAGRAAASSRAAPRRGASLSWGARLPSLAPAPGRQRSQNRGWEDPPEESGRA